MVLTATYLVSVFHHIKKKALEGFRPRGKASPKLNLVGRRDITDKFDEITSIFCRSARYEFDRYGMNRSCKHFDLNGVVFIGSHRERLDQLVTIDKLI